MSFARPVNWIVALLGESVLPFRFADVTSGAESIGPRGEGAPAFVVPVADAYAGLLASHRILADVDARRREVKRQIDAVAASIGVRVAENDDLLDEVTNLVEQPTALLCGFDAEFLDIPAPVLTSVMSKKQRYFTVLDADGRLIDKFITVRNGNAEHIELVRHGNEDVVRARFADAAYFFRQDMQKPLDAYLPRLDTITFQGKLGSMLDKSRRIESLVEPIAHQLGVQGAQLDAARKAAHLCKADLATNMVVEITALQGQMGRDYHKRTSTDADVNAVADAIFEHYLPRFAGDRSPSGTVGLVVGLADKLDSIAGLFAVGLAPKGSADPFALRRAAIGIVTNLLSARASFALRRGLESAAGRLPVKMDDKALDAAHAFIIDRARVIFEESGNRKDVVDAVLTEQGDDPYRAADALAVLNAAVQSEGWPVLLAAFARCARILRSAPPPEASDAVDPQPEAQALAQVAAALPPPTDARMLLRNLETLAPAIQTFFDKTMVMAEDIALRNTRLTLLGRIVAQARGIADLSKLEGF